MLFFLTSSNSISLKVRKTRLRKFRYPILGYFVTSGDIKNGKYLWIYFLNSSGLTFLMGVMSVPATFATGPQAQGPLCFCVTDAVLELVPSL